jgi:hypothetical protein
MAPVELAKNVYWVGAVDWASETSGFSEGISRIELMDQIAQ